MTLVDIVAANSVSQGLLTVLKFCFLALLYLFLVLVVRVVLRELRASAISAHLVEPIAAPVPPPPAPDPGRGSRRERRGGLRLQFHEPTGGPDVVALGDEMTIGRAAGCGIVLDHDTFISQVHARIFQQGSDTFLEDLGSTNGTFVNGDRLDAPIRLRRGDRVQFGNTLADVVR
ncbi:MAG: hypothetical protein JWL73_3169 [Actinomycetia bacterium]|nr:hypothetical protein [Actinomycetes bacterium]